METRFYVLRRARLFVGSERMQRLGPYKTEEAARKRKEAEEEAGLRSDEALVTFRIEVEEGRP